MIKKFLIQVCIFLIPVIIGYAIVENYTRNLPLTPKVKADFYKKYQDTIEILVLGASQNRDAINPEFLSQKTLNLAFPDQDYYVSSKLLEQLAPTLPSLKTVIIPISYGHFETAPNQKETWKNSMYRHYFGTKVSEKFTYFKDNFLYISFPNYYSAKIRDHRNGESHLDFNEFGYNNDVSTAIFQKLKYDSIVIAGQPIHITPPQPNLGFVAENAEKLEAILKYCNAHNYKVILIETPTTTRFKEQRIPEVLYRKDSIRSVVTAIYKMRYIEADSTQKYYLKDYRDDNHLSPQGAEKFTKRLNKIIE
ncbi:hypothetical protein [uncultured Dokdonia sp.]|mgnify:FL=1|uniref:hypothetical protein n=1 Tax=uncultured Dokdonia sp. TaxID=575653 RepID=UPI002621362C|nr:hypothetical protein [uncultured Dokdonia sp.]